MAWHVLAMKRFFLVTTFFSLLRYSVAVDLLCCGDAVYQFTINLERTCANSIVGGTGIAETSCMTTILPPFQEQGILLETVRRLDVFEISPGIGLVARQTFMGPLADGDVIEYQSVVGRNGLSPNAIQVVVTAETSDGVSIINVWGITFENSCILPVFPQGAAMGWTGVVSCRSCKSFLVNVSLVKGSHLAFIYATGYYMQQIDCRELRG